MLSRYFFSDRPAAQPIWPQRQPLQAELQTKLDARLPGVRMKPLLPKPETSSAFRPGLRLRIPRQAEGEPAWVGAARQLLFYYFAYGKTRGPLPGENRVVEETPD